MTVSSEPLVSVIIPTYNRKRLLHEAIESVLAQDLKEEFEIVVIDDGSTDNTPSSLENVDPRVRLVTQENSRRGRARNRGLEEARGRLVAFLDDDDRFEPWHLSQAVRTIGNSGAGVSAPVAFWDPHMGKIREIHPPKSAWRHPAAASLDGMVFLLPSLVIPKHLAVACGGFPDDVTIDGSEDLVFLIRLTAVCPLSQAPRRSVLIREHPLRGMKDTGYIIASRRRATDLLLDEGRCGHRLSEDERARLTGGAHRFAAALLYEQGSMQQARRELRLARRQIGGLRGLRDTLPLQLQSHLGPAATRLARRLKHRVVWR